MASSSMKHQRTRKGKGRVEHDALSLTQGMGIQDILDYSKYFSTKYLHNNQENDLKHLKKHTLLGQHTYTKITDLDPLKNTQPILANTETKLIFTERTRITLVIEDNLKSIQAESYSTTLINHTLLAISAL